MGWAFQLRIPAISFFAASNEIPNFSDPQEKILEALYDRLELKVVTANIEDRDKRLAVLRDKQAGRAGQIAASITLDELRAMQEEVADIPVPDAINELADDILCQLRKDDIPVSDQKYLNYHPIAQAKAWLSGHTQVEPQDLLALYRRVREQIFHQGPHGCGLRPLADAGLDGQGGQLAPLRRDCRRERLLRRLQVQGGPGAPASAGGPVEAAGGDPFGLPGDFSPNFGESSDDGSLPF